MYFFYLASYVYNVIATHTIENNYNIFFILCVVQAKYSMAVIWWLDYVNCTCNLTACFISLIVINPRQLRIVF